MQKDTRHNGECPSSVKQGRQDLNLQPTVLETVALPFELRPYFWITTYPVAMARIELATQRL